MIRWAWALVVIAFLLRPTGEIAVPDQVLVLVGLYIPA
jgi:hypothetical protein